MEQEKSTQILMKDNKQMTDTLFFIGKILKEQLDLLELKKNIRTVNAKTNTKNFLEKQKCTIINK